MPRSSSSSSPSSSSPQQQPPPPPPFDGSSNRRGLLHPASQVAVDPSPFPPPGEEPPNFFSVGAAQRNRRCAKCGGPLSVAWLEGRWRQACRGGKGGGGSGDKEEAGDGAVGVEGGCGEIAYRNPLVVVGTIVTHEEEAEAGEDEKDNTSNDDDGDNNNSESRRQEKKKKTNLKVLLVKRAIEPRKGCWSLPAGYLELGESSAAGAARETWEEARARVEVVAPFFHADVPAIGQSYLLFRGRLASSSASSSSSSSSDGEKIHPPLFAAGPESEEVALFGLDEIPKLDLAFSAVATALRLFADDVDRGFFHYHHGTIVKRPGEAPNAGTLVDHFALRIR